MFQIRYWGTTGTFTKSLLADEILDKLTQSIEELSRQGELSELAESRPGPDGIRRRLIDCLPFELYSTYGGNTTCVEINASSRLIILDAGSGMREFGRALSQRWRSEELADGRRADVLVTHTHMDHTYATPFFDPYYDPRNNFKIWAPQTVLDSLNTVLSPESEFRSVYFPINFDMMAGIKAFEPVEAGESFEIGNTHIKTYALHHPGNCVAYRLQQGDRSIVFASDHEHQEVPDHGLAEFARDADLLYTDAQYLQDEYDGVTGIAGEAPRSRHGWGHSCVEAAIQTAILADVKMLHLGHHEPKRTDRQLADLDRFARQYMQEALTKHGRSSDACQVQLAYEGMTMDI